MKDESKDFSIIHQMPVSECFLKIIIYGLHIGNSKAITWEKTAHLVRQKKMQEICLGKIGHFTKA